MDCSAAAPFIVADIENETIVTAKKLGTVQNPDLTIAEAQSKFETEVGYVADRYIGVSMDGPEMISQVMAINMLKKSLNQNVESTSDAAIMDYVNARAKVQARMSMSSLGGLMQNSLPILHSVLVILCVALFPIIIIFALLPGGGGVVKSYFFIFANLQTWPLMFSVFTRIVEGKTIEKMKALAKATTDGTGSPQVDMAILDPMSAVPDETSAICLMMIALIPGIGMMIFKGYGALASQLESTLRPYNVATETAAAEGASGNISLGNTNLQNQQVRTRSQDQVNVSPSVNAGLMTRYNPNTGARMLTTSGGQTQVYANEGIGNLALSGSASKTAQRSYNRRRASAQSQRQTSQRQYETSMAASKTDLMAGAMAMREGHSSQDVFGFDMSTSQRNALVNELSAREEYLESSGIATAEQYRSYLNKELAATVGFGVSKFGASAGVSASVKSGSENSSIERSDERFADAFSLGEGYRDTEGFSRAFTELSTQKDSLSKDRTNTLTHSFTGNLTDAKRHSNAVVNANNRIQSLEGAYNVSDTGQVSFSRSLAPDAMQLVYNNPNYSKAQADAILGDNGTNPHYMAVQAEAYERAVDMHMAHNPDYNVVSAQDMNLSAQDMDRGLEGNRESIKASYEGYAAGARNFSAGQSVVGDHNFESREEMAGLSEAKIYETGDRLGSQSRQAIGTSQADGGTAREVFSEYTPDARQEDAERYAWEVQEAYDAAPSEDRTVKEWFGGAVSLNKSVKVPDYTELQRPRTGTMRDNKDVEAPIYSNQGYYPAFNRSEGDYIPVTRGRGGQGIGVGALGAKPAAPLQARRAAPANTNEARDKSRFETPVSGGNLNAEDPNSRVIGAPRYRGPTGDIKKKLNEMPSPAPGMGAVDFASASALVYDRIGEILPQSIDQDIEYGGLVYKLDDSIHATPARIGQINPETGERSFDPKNSLQDVPFDEGAILIGDYHTHGGHSHDGEDYSGFSQRDIAAINADRGIFGIDESGSPHYVGGWLAGPEGEFSFYPAKSLSDDATGQEIEGGTVDLKPFELPDEMAQDQAFGVIQNNVIDSGFRVDPDEIGRSVKAVSALSGVDQQAVIEQLSENGHLEKFIDQAVDHGNTYGSKWLQNFMDTTSGNLDGSGLSLLYREFENRSPYTSRRFADAVSQNASPLARIDFARDLRGHFVDGHAINYEDGRVYKEYANAAAEALSSLPSYAASDAFSEIPKAQRSFMFLGASNLRGQWMDTDGFSKLMESAANLDSPALRGDFLDRGFQTLKKLDDYYDVHDNHIGRVSSNFVGGLSSDQLADLSPENLSVLSNGLVKTPDNFISTMDHLNGLSQSDNRDALLVQSFLETDKKDFKNAQFRQTGARSLALGLGGGRTAEQIQAHENTLNRVLGTRTGRALLADGNVTANGRIWAAQQLQDNPDTIT